ncbi:MAG TPA: substrate-binding domain-containing protein [Solirubrobacteraceae bacterium]|nr:substrate-binding domain-containing protein [Solirubrobacteraceae bacterium]
MRYRNVRRLVVGLIALLAPSCGAGGGSAHPGRSASVAAVIKGLDNPFFVTMRNGLEAGARHHSVEITVQAAAGLQDTAGQASALESLTSQQAGCYVVNPINQTNLIQPLGQIPDGVPIVNIDSPVSRQAARAVGVGITTYIGTNNGAAGRLAAAAMARLVPRGSRVAVITGIPGDASSGARTQGFMAAAAGRFHVVQMIAADFDRRRAELATAALLRSRPSVRGVFAVNDEMALGSAAAVGADRRRGKVAVIGVDGDAAALAAVKRGAMSATVAQYPYTIGQFAVEACLAAIHHKPIPGKIDAPIQIVTPGNVSRAQRNAPRPPEQFKDPLVRLLRG